MLSRIVTFIVYLLVMLTLTAMSAHGGGMRGDSILVVGDSLSAGLGIEPDQSWVALLQDRLTRQGYGYRVINASISGDTTTGGLRRLPRALAQNDPAVVVIELGGNDGLRGTPIRVMRDNLKRMIEMCTAIDVPVILAGMLMPPNYGQAYTDDFQNVYQELSQEDGVSLIPFFMKNVALDPALMQPDGIHPNAAGQPYLLENVWSVLEPTLNGFRKISAPAGLPAESGG